MSELTYEDFKQRLKIQDLLVDAGYQLNRRDGLRYPSYVRVDSDGRRIRGDKFLVTGNSNCCFKPPTYRVFNIISFIKEHPDFFADYRPGMDPDRLVNLVCNRLLNHPIEDRVSRIQDPIRQSKPFRLKDYDLFSFNKLDWSSQKRFYPFFVHRGIDLNTQSVFKDYFYLSTKNTQRQTKYANLAFPLRIPGKSEIVGFEERGRMNSLGTSYKGKAEGSNSAEGLWIANLSGKPLDKAEKVLWFESAYDAMAYYQLSRLDSKDKRAVYVSTGGNPTKRQLEGMLSATPIATHHLCFDNDQAGQRFATNYAYSPTPEWKEYVDSIRKPMVRNSGDPDLLPKSISSLYAKAESAEIEFYSSRSSGLVCKEDLEDLKKEALDAIKEFHEALDKALPIRGNMVFETPPEGYKDWNEALLSRIQKTEEVGLDDNIEEERKTSAFRR